MEDQYAVTSPELEKEVKAHLSKKFPGYEEAIDHLVSREGVPERVYRDSRKLLTYGMGHLVKDEQKSDFKYGQKVNKETILKQAEYDFKKALDAAQMDALMIGQRGNPVIEGALISVNHQLGTNWTKKFDKTWQYMRNGEWKKAAREVTLNSNATDLSDWLKQTPLRVEDFQRAIMTLD